MADVRKPHYVAIRVPGTVGDSGFSVALKEAMP